MRLAKFKTVMAVIAMVLMILLAVVISLGISMGREKNEILNYTDPDNGEEINTCLSDIAYNAKTIVNVAKKSGMENQAEYQNVVALLNTFDTASTLSGKYNSSVNIKEPIASLVESLKGINRENVLESDFLLLIEADAIIGNAYSKLDLIYSGTTVLDEYNKNVREFNSKINKIPYLIVKPFIGEIGD